MRVQLIRGGLMGAILLGTGLVWFAAASSDPAVKRSDNKICHERGTTDYEKTKHFKAFKSIEACLRSGGRLPKNASHNRSHFDPTKPAQPGDEGVLFGPLVKVIDGDTFIVKIQGAELRIRLIGIDAPEHDQPFGRNATSELASLIGKQQCVMVYDEGDMYGRLVVHLWVGGTYVNAEMVKRGMAWFDSESAQDNLLYTYEEEAREAKLGLWALPPADRLSPNEWREGKRAP